ncbi:type II toxin-antitoxin system VapC family toxin [Nocardioides sp. AE5]|uniref:type II toxin-antitoxin system VapC family toxin n=1 Tax=Nocardioides sp. AE5 TaxID=2962573 RepID=UPI002881046D|nr:type II toxin-antitoxin system VapC family toxin [Nocardioides sp. AE5]MDT0203827.1 type II toxin-antitoxin system VapC family toxin [Nocardioides sp. AE5]
MIERAVIGASVLVDLYAATPVGKVAAGRLRGLALHAPAHVDAEVMSALGRLHRSGALPAEHVQACLDDLATSPIERHPLAGLLVPAWRLRGSISLLDAAYVALAESLDAPLLTTDLRLARTAARAEAIGGE